MTDAHENGTQVTLNRLDRVGDVLVCVFQRVALFVIGGTIVWSAAHDYVAMMRSGRARLDDILLLFIYLELGTMVGIYFKTDRLPVLFLLFVAITAITRIMAVDAKVLPIDTLLAGTGAILILAFAVLVLQITQTKYPTGSETP